MRRAFRFFTLLLALGAVLLFVNLDIWPPHTLVALSTTNTLRVDVQDCNVNFEVHDIDAHYKGGAPHDYDGPALSSVSFAADVLIGGKNVTRNKLAQWSKDPSAFAFEPAASAGGEDVLRVLRDPSSSLPCNVTLHVRPGTVLPSVTIRAWQSRFTADGSRCTLPWSYQGETHYGCANVRSKVAWCSQRWHTGGFAKTLAEEAFRKGTKARGATQGTPGDAKGKCQEAATGADGGSRVTRAPGGDLLDFGANTLSVRGARVHVSLARVRAGRLDVRVGAGNLRVHGTTLTRSGSGYAPSVLRTVRRDVIGAKEGGTKEDETLREGGGDIEVRLWQDTNITFSSDCSQCFAADNATEPFGEPEAVQVPKPVTKAWLASKKKVTQTGCTQAGFPDPQQGLTTVGTNAFFVFDDGVTGNELWVHAAGSGGPTLVKDINKGNKDSDPHNLTGVGANLLFFATDGKYAEQLYQTDGTEGGTTLLKSFGQLTCTKAAAKKKKQGRTPGHGEDWWSVQRRAVCTGVALLRAEANEDADASAAAAAAAGLAAADAAAAALLPAQLLHLDNWHGSSTATVGDTTAAGADAWPTLAGAGVGGLRLDAQGRSDLAAVHTWAKGTEAHDHFVQIYVDGPAFEESVWVWTDNPVFLQAAPRFMHGLSGGLLVPLMRSVRVRVIGGEDIPALAGCAAFADMVEPEKDADALGRVAQLLLHTVRPPSDANVKNAQASRSYKWEHWGSSGWANKDAIALKTTRYDNDRNGWPGLSSFQSNVVVRTIEFVEQPARSGRYVAQDRTVSENVPLLVTIVISLVLALAFAIGAVIGLHEVAKKWKKALWDKIARGGRFQHLGRLLNDPQYNSPSYVQAMQRKRQKKRQLKVRKGGKGGGAAAAARKAAGVKEVYPWPHPFDIPEILATNFHRANLDSVSLYFDATIAERTAQQRGLAAQKIPFRAVKENYETFCLAHDYEVQNIRESGTGGDDDDDSEGHADAAKELMDSYGVSLSVTANTSTDAFCGVRLKTQKELLLWKRRPEQERRVKAHETSLTYFLRCVCVVTGLASDHIFTHGFRERYVAFVQVHVGLEVVAITKRDLGALGITFDRLRITFMTFSEGDWFAPIADAALYLRAKPSVGTVLPAWWWFADLSVFILHLMTVFVVGGFFIRLWMGFEFIYARQLFAEHYFRSNALHCTATARILIPAECSAVP